MSAFELFVVNIFMTTMLFYCIKYNSMWVFKIKNDALVIGLTIGLLIMPTNVVIACWALLFTML